ncbi:MAG: LysR family transcriptional regulator [Polyangiaceae bacterium]
MDKLRAMRTFAAIADAGSLTAAARALGGSLPAVVRLLAALEAELGTRLLQRTTRRIALTEAGRRYLERCRQVATLIDEAEAEVRSEQTEPRGRLVVTAPVLFGTRHVASGVTAFLQRYPDVHVDFQLLDRMVNLVEEGVDVGVRIGSRDDSTLIARHVGDMRRVTVAAPSYLARREAPEHPRDLLGHECIGRASPDSSAWTFVVNGAPMTIAVQGPLSVNQTGVAAAACLAGLGVGTFFAYQVAREVASGALELLLAGFEPPPRPIHVVYPEARLVPARTRMFIDFIMRHIQAEQSAWRLPEPKDRVVRAVPAPSKHARHVAKRSRATPRTK